MKKFLAGISFYTLLITGLIYFLQESILVALAAAPVVFALTFLAVKLFLYVVDKFIMKNTYEEHNKALNQQEEELAKTEKELLDIENLDQETQQVVINSYQELNENRNMPNKSESDDIDAKQDKDNKPSSFNQADPLEKINEEGVAKNRVAPTAKIATKLSANDKNIATAPNQAGVVQSFLSLLSRGSTFFNFETDGDRLRARYTDVNGRTDICLKRFEEIRGETNVTRDASGDLLRDIHAYSEELKQQIARKQQELAMLKSVQP